MLNSIPRQIVALATFPGVVLREVTDLLFCRWCEVAVLEVCYFQLGNPSGYVRYEPNLNLRKSFSMVIGPFFLNSLLGMVIAFPVVLQMMEFQVFTPSSSILAWLGVSIATQALPSPENVARLGEALEDDKSSPRLHALATPMLGLVRLVSAGRLLGLNLVYGCAAVAALPAVLLLFLR
jgi:hypothetical protein